MKNFKIIDFHTHPFVKNENICMYRDAFDMPETLIKEEMNSWGVSYVCGSVIDARPEKDVSWQGIKALNDTAIRLAEKYRGFYIPGFHVSPLFLKESLEEIERMHKLGINFVGELVPYIHGWGYGSENLDEIIDLITEYDMIFNFHTATIEEPFINMIKKHPKTRFVAAHPGEKGTFLLHLELMKENENYKLDISGTGVLRNRLLPYGIKMVGVERFLYGSDYPVCNPSAYIGGVALDPNLTDSEKEMIFYKNAARLLRETNNSYFVENN